MTIVMTEKDLQDLNGATFDAFIESGRYALSYTESCKQFGKATIDMLISHGLLENKSGKNSKKKYYISEIVTGLTILKNKTR